MCHKNDEWHHIWIFEHSSCHAVTLDDALDASKMNVNGGKQRIMKDTVARQGSEDELFIWCSKGNACGLARKVLILPE